MNTRPVRFLTLLALLLAWLPLSAAAAAPLAQEEQRLELRSTADYIYGQSMNFRLVGNNAEDVESVTLFIRLGVSSDSYSVELPFERGTEFELSYTLDLTQTRLPPFGSVTYWWQLERETQAVVRVPEQVISYVDDQFTWRQLVTTDEQGGGSVRIFWTGEDETLGEQARDIIFEILPEIGRLIPLERVIPFDVYIYPSSADLGAALRLAGRNYEPGQTYPDLGVLLVTVVNPETADSELRDGISRGLVDLLLQQSLNQFSLNLPPWIGAGLAGEVRDRSDLVTVDRLRSAVAAGTTIPVADLCDGIQLEDELAVAQSEALVGYIVANFGEKAMRDLVIYFAEGNDCPAAMNRALQLTPQQLETGWLRANSSDQTSRTAAEIGVWLALVLAGFALAGLLLLRPRNGN